MRYGSAPSGDLLEVPMRRVAGLALVLLGAFLLGTAAMARFYLPDRLVVTPIDQYAQTTAVGQGRWLDGTTFSEQTGDLAARRTVKGDVPASSEDVAVWDVSVVLETGTGTMVRTSVDRVATDRRTAGAVGCGGEPVDADPVRHSGVSYKFPFGTEKRDYAFWDVNSRRSYPARYVTEEQVQDLRTYKFIQQVPGQQLIRNNTPVWYEATRTVWVEPRTGVIVKGNEQNRTTLRDGSGQDRTTIVQFDLTFDEQSQRSQADLARDGISRTRLLTVWLPLLALLLGVLFVLGGFVLLRAATSRQPAHARRKEPPVPVGDSPS
jgi:Porin PorA